MSNSVKIVHCRVVQIPGVTLSVIPPEISSSVWSTIRRRISEAHDHRITSRIVPSIHDRLDFQSTADLFQNHRATGGIDSSGFNECYHGSAVGSESA